MTRLLFTALATCLLLSGCYKQNSNVANDPKDRAFLYLGPQDGSENKKLIIVSTPKDVKKATICRLGDDQKCLPTDPPQNLKPVKEGSERNFYQTASAFTIAAGTQFKVASSDNKFSRNITIGNASASAWKAVFVQADKTKAPAVEKVIAAFKEKGLEESAIYRLKDTKTTSADIQNSFANFKFSDSDRCLLYVSAAGQPSGLTLGSDKLSRDQLDKLMTKACGSRPSVIMLSGSFTGTFTEAPMNKPNLIVLTSTSEKDSAIQDANDATTPIWDHCLSQKLGAAESWSALQTELSSCVADKEKAQGSQAASNPKSHIGGSVSDLEVIKKVEADETENENEDGPETRPIIDLGENDFTFDRGENKETTKVSKLFGSAKYLMITASQPVCHYCNELAKQLKAMRMGKDCTKVTVVNRGELKQMAAEQRSVYYESKSVSKVIKDFGAQWGGAPTSVVIDQKGKKVHDFVGPIKTNVDDHTVWFQQNCSSP